MSNIRELIPIIIVKGEDGLYYPRSGGGFNQLILPSEFYSILNDLQYYCMFYTDEEIIEINNEREKEFYHSITNKHPKKVAYDGYVYMLKCADKYKIGYSKNVKRRVQELDTRPFKLKLLFAAYSDKARTIEYELHKRLHEYKEAGEWYSNITELIVRQMIDEIVKELGCDIRY